jgi:hypothetical protein
MEKISPGARGPGSRLAALASVTSMSCGGGVHHRLGRRQHAHAIVAGIRDKHVALAIQRQPAGIVQRNIQRRTVSPLYAASPVPAIVAILPSVVTMRTRLLPVSAM